jgi:hypothetical protein
MKRLVKLVKGGAGCGCNSNGITIQSIPADGEKSINYLAKIQTKAVEIFGKGASLNTVGTTYGVQLRFADYKTNLRIARLLIKIVDSEIELKQYKTLTKETKN